MSVREFVEAAFKVVGRDIFWCGVGVDEQGMDKATGNVLVRVDPSYFRPVEIQELRGDYSKAKAAFGWEPQIRFEELVQEMVEADLRVFKRNKTELC